MTSPPPTGSIPIVIPDHLDGPSSTSLRGLDPIYAGLSAAEVLAAVAWDGAALDPATTRAEDFLAVL